MVNSFWLAVLMDFIVLLPSDFPKRTHKYEYSDFLKFVNHFTCIRFLLLYLNSDWMVLDCILFWNLELI